MTWDDTKSTADDPNNPSGVEQLTATEWNNMVSDQKSRITGVSVEDDGTVVLETEEINFGSNLSVSDDGDGSVTVSASGSGTDTRTNVSESGTEVLTDVTDINFTESADATVSVSDDGDGSVTVDIAATDTNTDTHTDIEDNGTLAVGDVSSINFGNNVTVTDDGDGSVTVTVDATDTDTRTNISDDGTQVVAETTDINFADNVSVVDDGNGGVTINVTDTGDNLVIPVRATDATAIEIPELHVTGNPRYGVWLRSCSDVQLGTIDMSLTEEVEYGLVAEGINGLDSLQTALADPEVVEEDEE